MNFIVAPNRNHQIAERIDFHRVARHQHRGRGIFLDQRRPLDAVAGSERFAPIGRRRVNHLPP